MRIMKSDEVKDTMKESPRRYTNPFLSDEENEKVNLWNSQQLFTDKNVMECQLPELLVCYKEGAFHVKDICVDEGNGIPHGEMILFNEDNHDDIINDSSLHFSPMENYDEGVERNLDIPVQDLENSIPNDAKECGTKEEDTESVDPNELKNLSKDDDGDVNGISEKAPEKLKYSAESDTVPEAIDNYVPEYDKDPPLPSLKSLLESINGVNEKDQQPCQSCVEETLKKENEAEEVGTSVETTTTTVISNENIQGNNTFNGKTVITNGLHEAQKLENIHERGEGESSFSVAGPVSGLISYSGQIAFSGSISLRSDSSTTSTRSFAFPILQTEWNSSPVRMAKADRRRLQKHRGWRNGLLCCRF